jgi:protein TonB
MFEHSLIDLETRRQPRPRRWLSLPVAIALHLVALAAFALGSYWSVGTVPEPSLNVAYIDVALPPLPPPPAGGGAHPKPAPAPQPLRPPRLTAAPPVRQPDAVPDKPPAPAPDAPSVPLPPGPVSPSDQHDSGPDTGPVPGPGKRTGDPGPGVDEAPVHLTAEMSRPQPLQPIRPQYTELARRAGLQGTVILEAVIDEQGRATQVRVLRGLPMGLERAAVEAIERCPFKPAMMGNRPVKVYFNLTVNFTIQR